MLFARERSRRQAAERRQQVLGGQLAVREAQLSEAQRLARLGSWEWDVPSGTVTWSHELVRLTGLAPGPGVEAFASYLSLVPGESRREVARLFSLERASATPLVVRHRLERPDASGCWVLGHMSAVAWDANGAPIRVLGTMQDITEQKNAEDLLAHQALHDALTGLVNRGVLVDRLSRVLARPRSDDSLVAVVFLDLDQFKWVNDSRSHSVGDTLLVEVARRLERALGPSDTLARFGGDEFVVLCERLAEESDVFAVLDRLAEALAQPFVVEASVGPDLQDVTVTASMGVATGQPGAGAQAELLVRDAAIAMYRAKERGRARFEIFDAAMRDRAAVRLRTHAELHRAIEAGELDVYFQPVINPSTAELLGTEALVRWAHPTRGLLPPGDFVPQAEETGLIVPLGAAVLDRACAVTADWNSRRDRPLTVAVNLSARQLADPGLLDVVSGALIRSGLPPHLLCLEVTETVVMEDPQASGQLLGQLRALGVGIAVDDFGTGYSSLAYLLALPLDVLKVDRSFVAAMTQGGGGLAIATAVVALAQSLGLGVVAEGVETTEQRDLLVSLGVTSAQGWLWGRAVPADAAGWAALDRLGAPALGGALLPRARVPWSDTMDGAGADRQEGGV